MPKKTTGIIIVGAGSRGLGYAERIKKYGKNETVVGVADPNLERVARVRKIFPGINDSFVFDDWRKLFNLGKAADAVVIATQDRMHKDPAVAFADLGYNILLEKPMAATEEDCREIVRAVKKKGILFTVCHVLRYTEFFRTIRSLIKNKVIGDVVTIQHFENVGYWHMAHSFVRGNWRNKDESSFMLLAKSCHDIDILRYLVGKPCKRVQSFGSLMHFRKEHKPKAAGRATRCIKCRFENKCPYSALKIYLRDHFDKGNRRWPLTVLVDVVDRGSLLDALETGPYGRCVYECDNDVVDHQVVNLEYEGGTTASFTMSGFNIGNRNLIIQGTRGVMKADMGRNRIVTVDFLTEESTETIVNPAVNDYHGGGDDGLIREWLTALRTGNDSGLTTGPDESLETHLTTFLAEQSRAGSSVKNL